MSEKWAWDGPRNNIHVFQADDPNMRICFLTSDGPTEERANLIAAAPELLEALKNTTFALALIAQADGNEDYLKAARAAIAKAEGRS